ncbi:MAG: trehalase family glycosidase, partial [Chthoniobacteraceae bacterium]
VNYGFGNEVDGWDYAGSAWMKGLALLAGAPAPEPLASQPHPLPLAFRGHLARILGTIGADGRTRFGYNFSGEFVDDNLHTVIGCCAYLLYSGDTAFIRQQLPALERLLDGFIARRNADGLYDGGTPQHWYYDAMPSSGVNTYHNAFFYKALLDLAQMERAAGSAEEATRYDQLAADVKAAINRVLWWEDAPDGPRYCDWITPQGERVAYAADVCQWPPLALGVASAEQARKVVATLDRRIAELEKEHGYTGAASLSAYWPVPASINTHPANQGFGNYMNGGSFLAQTYWEIVGRARAGDTAGAWRRLQRFGEGTARHGWCGNNWFTMRGEIGHGACDEPYLSDMVVVPAALVQGLLGIRPTWEKLEVQPSLPADWRKVSAEVVWKGRRQHIRIVDGNATVEAGDIAFTPPRE